MRQKLLLFFLLISSFFFPFSTIAYAQVTQDSGKNTPLSLSDAVYADLAIRGYLDNVSVDYLDGPNNITINESRHWIPASTVKTYTAMYAYKQIADGKLHLTDTITISANNVVPTELVTDELPAIAEGDVVTIDRLIKQMITQSDNTAYNSLLDMLDRQEITKYIKSLGINHTNIGSKLNLDSSQEQYEFDVPGVGINTTTAEDYTKAFTLIQQNKIQGAKDLFDVLSLQKVNNMIPLLLPHDIIVAHKPGDLDPNFHDGGIIVAPGSSTILSIFTNVGDPNMVAHLSQLIFTKNYNLVGSAIPAKTLSDAAIPRQDIDPLVTNFSGREKVLGTSTKDLFQPPSITAADLGISASDLSLTIANKNLPKILIPADSPLHFISPLVQNLKKVFALGPDERTQVDLESLSLQIAEAKDLSQRGNYTQANTILRSVQQQLNTSVKNKIISSDAKNQTIIQSISQTRFTILGDELRHTTPTQRNTIIKEIASQAKETIKQVQPFIPQASVATNPAQKPLIGEIIKVTATTATIKTSVGQEVTIPLSNPNLKVRSQNPSIKSSVSVATIIPGTTVAIVGSAVGNKFNPSFILTNLPNQLAAPEPVTVLKVNPKNNTMVVSQNGIPIQVNVTSSTIIKGTDTNISMNSIKLGDVVVVHGVPITPSPTIAQANVSPVPSAHNEPLPSSLKQILSPVIKSQQSGNSENPPAFPTTILKRTLLPSTAPEIQISPRTFPVISAALNTLAHPAKPQDTSNKSPLAPVNEDTIVKNSNSLPQQNTNPQKNVLPPSEPAKQTPVSTTPRIIKSTTIEVIEKKQDVINAISHEKTRQIQAQQESQSQQLPKSSNIQHTDVKCNNCKNN